MKRIIKHKWIKSGFLRWECDRCHCVKYRIIPIPDLGQIIYHYFRNGVQLSGLPECKTTFHNDKI